MRCKTAILVATFLLALAQLRIGTVFAQEDAGNPKKNESPNADDKKSGSTASLKIKISAEGKTSLPTGSRIEWKNLDDKSESVTGVKNLESSGTTPVSLPVGKVKLWIYITGFDTKAVTLDLGGKEDKYNDPIRMTVKHQGPVEVEW